VLPEFLSCVASSALLLECVAVVEHNAIPHQKGIKNLNHETNLQHGSVVAAVRSDDVINAKTFM
jgi:hypothetical protein